MKLSYVIEEIEKNIKSRENYLAYILKDISKLEEDEDEIELFPIFDIDIEEDEKEITLLSSELNEDPNQTHEPFTLNELFSKLKDIDPQISDFGMFSGSSVIKLDDEHDGRLDTPLVAYGFNDDEKTFVLIQSEPKN